MKILTPGFGAVIAGILKDIYLKSLEHVCQTWI